MIDRVLLLEIRNKLADWCQTTNKTVKYRKKPWGKKKKKNITQHKFNSNEALIAWVTIIDSLLGESGGGTGTAAWKIPYSDVEYEELGIEPKIHLRDVKGGTIVCNGNNEESITIAVEGANQGSKVVVIGDGDTTILGDKLGNGTAKMYVYANGWKTLDQLQ